MSGRVPRIRTASLNNGIKTSHSTMLFNSINFILFFVAAVLVYYALQSNRIRKGFLLFASYYFYACWNISFLLILLYVTALSYLLGKKLERAHTKGWLTAGITALLLPLLGFKYLNFFFSVVNDSIHLLGGTMTVPAVEWLLPVGISFYTFIAIGYVVDVSKKKVKAEHCPLDYALFIGFFPQIASGPIARADGLLPQFKEKRPFAYDDFAAGARMMLWGFFMKLAVGDRAGIYVDTIFGNYADHSGPSLWMATFMYSIQIYCDFAGYSLIAIGCARVMGYRLMTNFARPYFATSVGDFWRRWHISLSTWFRDYVYIPLGGNRRGERRRYLNLCITFLVSGLWHGAAYNFITWGGFHALYQIAENKTKGLRDRLWGRIPRGWGEKLKNGIRRVATFVVVSYLWMVFRTSNFDDVIAITKGYFKPGAPYIHPTSMLFFAMAFTLLFIKDFKDEFFPNRHFLLESRHLPVRCISFALLAILIVFIGVIGGGQFIYFQF